MIQRYKNFVPDIDETCFIAPGSVIIGNVKIGNNSVIRGDMAGITIGDNTNIQDSCVLHCMIDCEIHIGNNVTVGHGAILHSCDIQDSSLIGMGSIVLDNVKIGKHCLIGAGSVVTRNTVVPDVSLVVGSPGIVKRQLTDAEIAHIQHSSEEYIKLAGNFKEI
jgi:carbonic anhydrase/acetyltransferase-like protein (isoleucine patch superfamily)